MTLILLQSYIRLYNKINNTAETDMDFFRRIPEIIDISIGIGV